MVLAHERWFTQARPGFDWGFAAEPATLALIGGAVAVAVAWRLAAARIQPPELPFLAPLALLVPYMPRLLAIHAGVSLVAQAARGTYLAPALELPDGALGSAIAIAEGLVGVWLISGYRVRAAAWLLVAAGPVGMLTYDVVSILERVDLLGIAAFLVMLPPGDRPAGAVHPPPDRLAPALFSLRALVGASLVVLAFTEKLARPELAHAFLDRYPAFNLLQTLGLEVSDELFIRLAGSVELLFGLLLISGALPQVVVILAGIPFNATLFFLGAEELIGHLPIYGAMLALLVYGSSRSLAPVVPWFPGRPVPSRAAPAPT